MKIVFVEQSRCLGCRNCERVCSFQETGGFKREDASIWVHVDLDQRTFFTLTCQQCENAACLQICPTGALARDAATNAIVVDKARCVGCRMCVTACPFGCIHFEEMLQTAAKCDLCHGQPRCVQHCMAGALHFGDINELSEIKRRKIDRGLVRTTLLGKGEQRR
jgi:Fe-S-cluster-containing dehydrogenase component